MTSSSAALNLDRFFTRMSYVTFGLAGACLCWAESGLIPEIEMIAGLYALLLIGAYAMEGRWTISLAASNVLGGVVGILAAAWIAFQLLRPGETVLKTLPWPVNMVPMVGPVLLILLLAKLVRKQTTTDQWALQGIALAIVGLSCALADDLVFALLMFCYVVSALWTLSLFSQIRNRASAGPSVSSASSDVPRLKRVLSWSAPVIGIGLVGFYALPRTEQVWQIPGKQRRMETGATEEQSIDLNRVGQLELNPELGQKPDYRRRMRPASNIQELMLAMLRSAFFLHFGIKS